MGDSASSWQQWVNDFLHGRTHVAYALILATVLSAYGSVTEPLLGLRVVFVIVLICTVGSLVDTVAHLYYHLYR